jgi:hypothetical protein
VERVSPPPGASVDKEQATGSTRGRGVSEQPAAAAAAVSRSRAPPEAQWKKMTPHLIRTLAAAAPATWGRRGGAGAQETAAMDERVICWTEPGKS